MISFGELEGRARILYEAQSSVRWNRDAFLRAANEGLDELSEATRFYERNATVPLKGNQTYYDLRGFWPEDAFVVNSVYSNVQQAWLTPIGIRDLKVQRWETVTGDPRRFIIRGLFWMGVYPRPSGHVGSLRVYFASLAPHFRDTYSVLTADMPDDFVSALEHYILYDLSCRDGETKKAFGYWADYQTDEMALKAFVADRLSSRAGALSGGP